MKCDGTGEACDDERITVVGLEVNNVLVLDHLANHAGHHSELGQEYEHNEVHAAVDLVSVQFILDDVCLQETEVC